MHAVKQTRQRPCLELASDDEFQAGDSRSGTLQLTPLVCAVDSAVYAELDRSQFGGLERLDHSEDSLDGATVSRGERA